MARPTLIPRLVAAIQSHGTNRLSASHWAVPTTAPAIKPPPRAAPTESTAPTARFAIKPPIGKPRRAASGHAQTRGRLSVPIAVGWELVRDMEVIVSFHRAQRARVGKVVCLPHLRGWLGGSLGLGGPLGLGP